MIINGLQVFVQYPVKTKKFHKWGLSKSKVGKRYIKLYKVQYEDLLSDGHALVYKDKILVTPKMYEALKNEINLKEPQSLRGGFPNPYQTGRRTYPDYW